MFSSVTTSTSPPRTISSAAIGDLNEFTSTWTSSVRFPSEIWKFSSLSLTSTIDDKIYVWCPRCLFMRIYGINWKETPDNNNGCKMQNGWVRFVKYVFYIPRFSDRKQTRVQAKWQKLGPSLHGMNRPQRAWSRWLEELYNNFSFVR